MTLGPWTLWLALSACGGTCGSDLSDSCDPCLRTVEVPLEDAEAEVGVDAEAEQARLTSLHDVDWPAAPWSVRFDLEVEEPGAFRNGDPEACPPDPVGIGSDVAGTVASDGYFTAEVAGHAGYQSAGTHVDFGGEVSADAGLEDYLLELGYPMERVEGLWLTQLGSPDSGELILEMRPLGGESFVLIEGPWERAEP